MSSQPDKSLSKTLRRFFALMTALLPAATQHAIALPAVNSLGGGLVGYADGNTYSTALFNTPAGMAADVSGRYLYLADRDNSRIRILDLTAQTTITFPAISTNLIAKPIALSLNSAGNVTVLNRANTTNGSIITFNKYGESIFTNALKLTNATGMALDSVGNIYVTVQSNKIIRLDAGTTNRTTVATVAETGATLQGLTVKLNGMIVVCDSARNGLYQVNPTNGLVTTNAGFHGAGDFVTNNINSTSGSLAKFRQPMNVLEAGDGSLVVSDYGNNRVKVILTTGEVTNLYGISSTYWSGFTPGVEDGSVQIPDSLTPNVQARLPYGLLLGFDGSLYTTEQYYHAIRKVTGAGLVAPPPAAPAAPLNLVATTNFGQVVLTWSSSVGATNYYIKRSFINGGPYTVIASTSALTYTDTNVFNGTTYYYVISASNSGGEGANSTQISARPPLPPVPDPQIGYVDFPSTSVPVAYTSVFHPTASFDFFNDALIVIKGTIGSGTYYTYGYTTNTSSVTNPTVSSASVLSDYTDGLDQGGVTPYVVSAVAPYLTVKAFGHKGDGSPDSAVTQATFQFKTGNPNINGNNGAQFTLSDITAGAHLYYTLDGSNPSSTNANSVDLGTVASSTNVWTVSFPVANNTLFKVRAFRANYQPSEIVSRTFLPSDFIANTISFGFAAQEASSVFLATPGQTFYAPVTLSILPNTTMYSLQFNITVTNSGPHPITPGAFAFRSRLVKPSTSTNLPSVTLYEAIPPYMFANYTTVTTNIVSYNGTNFINLSFTNAALNLIGVGWLERSGAGLTNLFNTGSQDLITYSIVHDTLFLKSSGKVIVGNYSFQVPTNSANGETYPIQIGRPSATSDGFGANGTDIYIFAPTNGSTGAGTIGALKYVTVTNSIKYLVGSVFPFRWWNAGDFGSSNLIAADVAQVFQSAVYNLNNPEFQAPGSDFMDAMDSAGNIGKLDSSSGYYTNSGPSPTGADPLFDSNDSTSINQVAFGDQKIDVADVFVTFRRSLDPSLTWFRRFRNNGIIVADTNAANVSAHVLTKSVATASSTIKSKVASTTPPQVSFTAGDVIGSAGQTVQIPITATILGSYPLRMLMLNLTVVPLDGSPAITTPVSFGQISAVLGAPYTTSSQGSGNYAAVWLNSTNAGITGTAVIGNLNVTIPAAAGTKAAYAIHFDHASASPNGLASFKNQTLTGVLTTTTRTNSSYGDGIPDSWRLRWFGTTNNSLSASNACPSGDGVINWNKFVAGVDPNSGNNFPKVNPKSAVTAGYTASIHWPSVSGKKYAIERSATLFSGSWSVLTTNTGTGGDLGYDDNTTNKVKFYRVRILP